VRAIVHDTTAGGPLGPVLGERYRLEVAPTFGGLQMVNTSLDYRRYIMPVRSADHRCARAAPGALWPDSEDARIAPFFLAIPISSADGT
jgi:hypothetical protein